LRKPSEVRVRIDIRPGDSAWEVAGPLLNAVWPPEVVATLPWGHLVTAHADRRVMVVDGGELVSHIGLFLRSCDWDGREVQIGGIGGVVTAERQRGFGFASAGMKAAIEALAGEHHVDFGMLFCEPRNTAFYERLGWHAFGGTVFAEQPDGRIHHDSVAPFVYDIELAPRDGTIDLRGLPW
jgi:aminoglycoside 2'-N-acetyltransferase I